MKKINTLLLLVVLVTLKVEVNTTNIKIKDVDKEDTKISIPHVNPINTVKRKAVYISRTTPYDIRGSCTQNIFLTNIVYFNTS